MTVLIIAAFFILSIVTQLFLLTDSKDEVISADEFTSCYSDFSRATRQVTTLLGR